MLTKLRSLFLVGFLFSFAPLAHPQVQSELSVEFEMIDGRLALDLDSLDELALDPERAELAGQLFDLTAQYQSDRNEVLGVTLDLAPNGEPVLRPDFSLSPNQVAISEELLERYRGGVIGGVRGDEDTPESLEEDVTNDLVRSLLGEGAYGASSDIIRPRKGQEQTVNPIDTGINVDDEVKVQELCQTDPQMCLPRVEGSPGADGILIQADQILGVLEAIKAPSTADNTCARAQRLFRSEVEFDGSNGASFNDWRDEPQAEAIARDFDDACLDGAASIDPRILDRLAVLKMPSVETPFCTAFRTGPTTFLTARHCFHNRRRGRPIPNRMTEAQVFMFRAPDIAIEIEDVPASDVFDTRHQPNKEIRSIDDFIVLSAITADPTVLPLSVSAPVVGAELVVPGHFVFADRRGVTVGPDTWQTEIRASRRLAGGYCRIYDYAESATGGACLIHRCQVMPGFSGSPMVQFDSSNNMSLIGVHVRGEGYLAHHCPAPFKIGGLNPISRRGNIGVLPPPGSVD